MITVIFDNENGIALPDVKVQEFANDLISKGEGTVYVSQMLIIDAIRVAVLKNKFDPKKIIFEVHDGDKKTSVNIDSDAGMSDWHPFPDVQMKLLQILARWE
ncbi:hypothetical protein pEaSNUABM50_00362 [Erwinia phage pEa_SNUABM_50]|uniref:Uncharacterized protein n=2 Tax=Eneladusvirus BF TaxID=2560751 RepID=A0A7L8ZPG1_9CAUD|nr:hypothetical protein pEaSNUABM12_00366 [Erwinia phage pEa_SNUABM_12]QOI72386.1 hypothetical protein pEaSNUABM50_00362 [Erwinia phage pEa_SNUABM_50]QXO11513.1 hypothetical protein pEaSNUABM19_00367 [Erwinia phage pEa_SNUABM_19]